MKKKYMIKNTSYASLLLVFFLSANLALYSCKDNKKEESTTVPGPSPDTAMTTPPPAPVIIEADDPLTKSVTDATKDYPTVKANVDDGVITLTGEIKRSDLQKLMVSLNELRPKKIDNQLVIK